MATLNPVQWEKPLSLDRQSPSLHVLEVPLPSLQNPSFLHSQKLRENLIESRKAFLRNLNEDEKLEPNNEPRKTPTKKISFKIKKTASIYRHNQKMSTISASKVAELTMKFNMINEKNSLLEQPKFRKLVKRVNSQRSLDSDKVTKHSVKNVVTRKPSVKTKPYEDKEIVIVRRKPTIKRKPSRANLEKPVLVTEQNRPTTLPLDEPQPPSTGTVRAAIEIFERRNSSPVPKPKVPEKPTKLKPDKTDEDLVQIVNIPAVLPQRRCDSMYETLNVTKTPLLKPTKSEETIVRPKPNTSFLWSINQDKSPSAKDDWKDLYDFVDPSPQVPPRAAPAKPPTPPKKTFMKPPPEEKIYEELNVSRDEDTISHSYEYCEGDDGYEICAKENIYETLPPPLLPRRQQQEPLPPRPPSRSSYCTIQNPENVSNCYESIYNPESKSNESTYESIYGCQIREGGSNRDSLVSSDQQSNSLYGRASLVGWGEDGTNPYSGKATSDLSTSDRSDDWVDMTDNEDNDNNNEIIIIRERQKAKKTTGWSQQFREQWSKSPRKLPTDQRTDSDPDHLYERLCTNENTQDDDYDSFDSDSDSEGSFTKVNSHDSGLDIGNSQLPEPPNNQTYVLTRLAATAGKHMRKLRRNWSLTKNDISKSLSRMTKRKSRTDLAKHRKSSPEILQPEEPPPPCDNPPEAEAKTLPRKSFLTKFRRSMSLSAESASELTSNLDKPKSTFYLTEIDIDKNESERDSGASLSPVQRNSKVITRPQSPPPPAPVREKKRSTSWYAEVGLFKNSESNAQRRSNTFWYAEVGLYQTGMSTPSTSSAENSGNTTNVSIKPDDFINQDNSEEYYNLKNGSDYYNDSINSFSSTETKKDQSLTTLATDAHLRLEDEPLYQFYDAAVLESVCHDGVSDFDSDGYEEVGDNNSESTLSSRPSAMELVTPNKNLLTVSRTLWCEIPEVIQSSVLSTLSTHQKKLQEAKFEMITSEASYLNSLNVLCNHFVKSFESLDILSKDELEMLFGKVADVKNCSEKLISDLEKCWQENILLHGVCDIVQKHAEENFHVYVPYCENQILLDDTLRRIKERPNFLEQLKQLESSSTCQSLTLYSFLMLPMQRITRWPLLVDAVLKRLSPQDSEYLTCQYALATLNKIVSQCNEGARRKERENEMKKIVTQLEFAKGVPPIEIVSDNRWLIRSGTVTHMQQRNDEIKLTFGKRFTKVTLHLFLFNDYLFVTKPKSENLYTVVHYCARNLVELSSTDMLVSLPVKDTQGRHLLFLTILENQNDKTVEFLLSCNSESDKERWIEALTPPKSEDPNETLYECWDCPQVTAIHNYLASQPDELALSRGDVINVLRKMADGWYHGERIRDGQTGWFPANYTVEIANPHVRSRNLKQRYRLLAFSENYLKTK
ncbi:uncharacterized protein Exn [Tribolium castaneum]|uniref:Uncharacterized protein n=1 Tax=Tribolium castaneum TaxID=7070 RepID=D6WZ80_TRICA|nr:PREDICTED: uncharacterized protein LOC663644 [Tribolium castaneum]XP_008198112.1 PREDICTED: uncharacterized protein LOC663644 [Tribolium castaneum]EFA09747.2 hypothetical protein TcasGA2_TC011886 [Tribolium castaneum]|eukprot:XP_008198111.1 PREDICTED: uncharacterized protein LOC663644 [Tribolium castaneum]